MSFTIFQPKNNLCRQQVDGVKKYKLQSNTITSNQSDRSNDPQAGNEKLAEFPPPFFFYGLCSPEFIGGNLAPLTSARLPRTDDSKTQSDRENRHPQILTQVSATRDSNPVKTAFRQPPSSLRVLLAYRRAWPSDNMSQTWLGYFVQCVM